MKPPLVNDHNEEWPDYLRKVTAEIRTGYRTLGEKVKADMKRIWLEEIGPEKLNAMMISRKNAEDFLNDCDPRIRAARSMLSRTIGG